MNAPDSAEWKKEFCFLPKACGLSGQILWMKYAYHLSFVEEVGTYDYYRIVRSSWHEINEHIVWQLSNKEETE